ncbi:MAG: hypothetical protein J6K51_05930 [Clostridia bacterium]|nr:hypothetical protein [Clostridia bacterium]
MDEQLRDDRFEFLRDMGFLAEDINEQLHLWNDTVISWAGDECLRWDYMDNLKTLCDRCEDKRFILYLFFLYSDSFAIRNDTFRERLQFLEEAVGSDFYIRLQDDFYTHGESQIFDTVAILNNDGTWKKTVAPMAERLKNEIFE